MKENKSSIQFHDKKPGGLHVVGKTKYFRSILGRFISGLFVPYLYESVKGGFSTTPMTPEDTLNILPQYGKLPGKRSAKVNGRSNVSDRPTQASRNKASSKGNKGKTKKTKR